ncbi:unnamed protein product [Thelazia callipaeda]|uniref:Uncharacterized protein n=1 Tax=Thelazia callipaeda TaxID=103827 RepID=A0A0N5CVY4_THECL|nr:unnamed protein product [Thelazia callipaeda]
MTSAERFVSEISNYYYDQQQQQSNPRSTTTSNNTPQPAGPTPAPPVPPSGSPYYPNAQYNGPDSGHHGPVRAISHIALYLITFKAYEVTHPHFILIESPSSFSSFKDLLTVPILLITCARKLALASVESKTYLIISSSCGFNNSDWNKNEKDGEKVDDDEEKNSVAVYPWMTRVHSTNG